MGVPVSERGLRKDHLSEPEQRDERAGRLQVLCAQRARRSGSGRSRDARPRLRHPCTVPWHGQALAVEVHRCRPPGSSSLRQHHASRRAMPILYPPRAWRSKTSRGRHEVGRLHTAGAVPERQYSMDVALQQLRNHRLAQTEQRTNPRAVLPALREVRAQPDRAACGCMPWHTCSSAR